MDLFLKDDQVISYSTTQYGRENRVELWTGAQSPNTSANSTTVIGQTIPLVPATKHHRFIMSDALTKITIQSYGGHSTVYDDAFLTQSVTTTSAYGHTLKFDDLQKTITLNTTLGYSYSASDINNQILITTPTKTTSVIISDLLTSITCPGPITVTSSALVAIVGNGITMTSSGTAPCITVAGGISTNTFTGLVTETYIGGLIQTVAGIQDVTASVSNLTAGIWNVTVGVANLLVPNLILGTGTQYFLVNQQFFNYYNGHTHAASAGLGPPDAMWQITPALLPLVATQQVKAS